MANDEPDALLVVREVIRATHDCVAHIERTNGFEWSPGSPAELDDSANGDISYKWGPSPFMVVKQVAGSYTLVCEDHLQALGRVSTEPLPTFATITVARAVLETAARAWWLHDPDASPSDRLGRSWTELLKARHERARSPEPIQTEQAQEVSVEERATGGANADGLSCGHDRTGAIWVGRPRPSTTDLVKWMDLGVGEAAWRWMSGVAHGMPAHVLMQTEALADDRSPTGRLLRESSGALRYYAYRVLVPAIEAHAEAYQRRILYHGWDDAEWRQHRQYAVTVLSSL